MKKKYTGYASIDNPQNNGYNYSAVHPKIPNLSIYNSIYLTNINNFSNQAIDCLKLKATYQDLVNDSVTMSLSLRNLGVKEKDIVSICMPNLYHAVVSFLACNRIGATATFLNYGSSNDEIKEYLKLFSSPVFINFNKNAYENEDFLTSTDVKHVITLDKFNINNKCLINDVLSSDDVIDYNTLGNYVGTEKKHIELPSKHNDALILYTSGTTGKPKSVVLTNENILAAGTYLKNSSHSKDLNGNRTLVCVPFTYPYGFATSTIMTLLTGKTAILGPDISKDTITYYLRKKPNIIFGSPALLDLIMKNTKDEENLSSITTFISGGDFLTPDHAKEAQLFFGRHNAYNVEIGNGSGNAETVSCGTNPTGVKVKLETAGKVLVGSSAMIVDPETLEEKKYLEEGMLCISGKHVFKEYYNDPELTKDSKFIKNGKEYFKTGTIGFLDDEGYFTITGRLSRFYIMSSLNKVYLDRVQNIINSYSIVKECAVVKVPDKEMLYVNKVYVVLNDQNLNNDMTIDYIKELFKKPTILSNGESAELKWYEIPTYVEIVNELPMTTGNAKIDYKYLEEDAIQKIEKQYTRKKIK